MAGIYNIPAVLPPRSTLFILAKSLVSDAGIVELGTMMLSMQNIKILEV